MKTIKIQKFINDQHENTINIPAALVDVLSFILPKSGLNELQKHGIDIPALELACQQSTAYSKAIEVQEGSVHKKIVISVE